MAKKLSKQKELALAISEKCAELGCKTPGDTAEVLGGATLFILDAIASYIGSSLEETREAYVSGLLAAELG